MGNSQLPEWLSLLSPIPADVVPERKPVASAEQRARGTAGAIARWHSVMIHLSDLLAGSRHVLVTLDDTGRILSAGDHVMFIRQVSPDGIVRVSEHESIGGRYEPDGSFHGTRWHTRMVAVPESDDEDAHIKSTSSPPSDQEIDMLNKLIADVMSRDADRRSR